MVAIRACPLTFNGARNLIANSLSVQAGRETRSKASAVMEKKLKPRTKKVPNSTILVCKRPSVHPCRHAFLLILSLGFSESCSILACF